MSGTKENAFLNNFCYFVPASMYYINYVVTVDPGSFEVHVQ